MNPSRCRLVPRTAALIALAVIWTACANDADRAVDASRAPAAAEPVTANRRGAAGSDLVRVTRIGQFPNMATSVTAPSVGNEILVSDRRGVIRRYVRRRSGEFTVPELQPVPVADFSDDVSLEFDRGFLSMVFVDDDRSLAVMYTAGNGDSVLQQYPYQPGEPLVRAESRTLFRWRWPYPWHHGGGLAVDRSGNLLVGIGDKGVSVPGVPPSQDPTLLLGGVMRVPASVLADASSDWQPTPEGMIARGLRNPWRISVDRANGDVWIGDVGDLTSEELNRIPGADLAPDAPAGRPNFGYPYLEGTHTRYERIPDGLDLVRPTLERQHGDGVCGMVAGFRYRGRAIPELRGRFVYADLCGDELRALTLSDDGDVVADDPVGRLPETIVSLGQDSAGELYATGYIGGVFRFDPREWDVADNAQEPSDPVPATEPPIAPDLDCGIGAAIEPLSFMNGMGPAELEEEITATIANLEARVPLLPNELRDAGATILRVARYFSERYEAVGWDTAAPELAPLRAELLDASGAVGGFPEAITRFYGSRCY